MTPHTGQEGIKKFIIYITEVSGESRAGLLSKVRNGLREQGEEVAFLWLGTEIKVSICVGKRFESPMAAKEGNRAPGLCYQLVRV